jgi:hypothetical protein
MLFVLSEIIMQLLGKSICFTEGCKIVARLVRFGDISILILGMLMFSTLAVLMKWNLSRSTLVLERVINILIIVSLACEGFFMGYLAFRVEMVCVFCVVIFCLLVTLGVLRLLARHHEVFAGFAALGAIFMLLYLVLPVGVTAKLPVNERLILFYSKDCKYCAEIKAELDAKKITVAQLDAGTYAGLLNSLNIDGVPTLLVNEQSQKLIFVGRDSIKRYLQACTADMNAAAKPLANNKVLKNGTPAKTVSNALSTDIFNQPNILTQPSGSVPASGLCKEEEVCK